MKVRTHSDPTHWCDTQRAVRGRAQGNSGEGFVIRPTREHRNAYGDRVLHKVKNPAWSETAAGPAPAATGGAAPVSPYVTAARVSNVLGKELPSSLVFANFGQLLELVVADAVRDEPAAAVSDALASLRRTAGALVRAHLKDIGAEAARGGSGSGGGGGGSTEKR